MARRLFRRSERCRLHLHSTSIVLVAFLMTYVLLWNLREWNEDRWGWFPSSLDGIARVTGLDQRWDMFAPCPTVDDGWFVMRGVLRDRTEVDLWNMTDGLSREKPDRVGESCRNQRWRQ